ncbi:S-adenosyl-L-methionine-dependent methyltransferase [Crucibulum laeve]|uniref:S-adenosyl-L-methionine-dependent methyltransferase n=1 Tax=Crucibulum laeve TaxID=68775 RepID=A0A5C3MCR6_9AGAR|nr:S-adenosyl-L-methionine-dependent methyltransferase [Crucibulum laeve]
MSGVHEVARGGFGSGTNELYDRARPSYQPAALSYIRNAIKADAPLNIAEIGAGTGIFTRALLSHPEWSSAVKQLQAVEPSEGMRDVFTKSIHDDRVSVTEGTFQETGVEDGWADVVVVAQAFHWCPDYDAASLEFARILKPQGTLIMIWNLEDREAAGWVAKVRNTIEKHENGTPQFRLGLWRQAFDTTSYQKYFEPPQEEVWTYTLHGSTDIVLDRANSKSYIALLPAEEKAKVREQLKAVLEEGEGRVWIDESKGTFEYPYKTFVVAARKK